MSDALPAAPSARELRQLALDDKTEQAPIRLVLGGKTFIVAAPTIGEHESIQSKSIKVTEGKNGKANVDVDSGKRKALAIITLVRTETGQPVFEDTDINVILAAKKGSALDKLGVAALEQLGGEKEEELEKN